MVIIVHVCISYFLSIYWGLRRGSHNVFEGRAMHLSYPLIWMPVDVPERYDALLEGLRTKRKLAEE